MLTDSNSSKRLQTSKLLQHFLQRHSGDYVCLRDLLHDLGDRAFSPTLLICVLPEILPLPIAGMSAIVGIPLMLVSAQLLLGFSEPWLPGWIADRSFRRTVFEKIVGKLLHYLEKFEKVSRPRWGFATTPLVERLLGLLLLVLAIVIALPIPFGNMPPAITIFVICLGLIEKDGVVVIAGVVGACLVLTLMAGAIATFFSLALRFLMSTFG